MNRVQLFGNVGKDPEIKTFDGGKKLAKFSLATQSGYKDKDGNKVTQWHSIVFFDKLAELVEKYVKKGNQLIVEGEIRYEKYTDKEGVVKNFTQINGNSLHFVGKSEQKQDVKPENQSANSGIESHDDDPF